jgi:hypothetical protein
MEIKARLTRAPSIALLPVSRDCDQHYAVELVLLPQSPRHFVTVDAWQTDVAQHDFGMEAPRCRDTFRPRMPE